MGIVFEFAVSGIYNWFIVGSGGNRECPKTFVEATLVVALLQGVGMKGNHKGCPYPIIRAFRRSYTIAIHQK